MKKAIYLFSASVIFGLLIVACEEKTSVKQSCLTKEDSIKIKAWDALLTTKKSLISGAGQVVHSIYAEACAKAYKDIYLNGKDITPVNDAKTESVGFGAPEFATWSATLPYRCNYNSLRIVFGIYVDPKTDTTNNNYGLTKDQIKMLTDLDSNQQNKIGRLTAFLWPYHDSLPAIKNKDASKNTLDDEKEDPLNLGQLIP